jgi:spermidine synthase
MRWSTRLVFTVVMLCLLVSGMAGLLYEVVWARYLALFLGHTSYAVVVVLVAFMGGLALGNAWFGARADRSRRPLAFYAWLEIGIGICAEVFPPYYTFCHETFARLARGLEPGSTGLLTIKFAFGVLSVLLPTMLMGGTLPVLTRLVARSLGEVREKVAALYFVNSGGAVVGCWVADFWLLPAMGLKATILAGALMNLAVGAVALLMSIWLREGTEARVEPAPQPAPVASSAEPAADEESYSRGELRLAVWAIGASGFVAMLYQVAWTRLLALVLGASTHAFSLMLMTFIAGITAGSYAVYRWRRLRRTLAAFGWTELALALTLAGSMFLYQYLPFWFTKLAAFLARQPESYPLYEFAQGLICFLVMFVPTFCLGMTLPLASRVATAEAARAGSSVGRVFAVNTLGTVLGAGLTGLWLMPRLGLARTFAVGVALNGLIGLVILLRSQGRRRKVLLAAAPVLAAGLVLGAGALFNRTWQVAFTMGLWRQKTPPPSWAEMRQAARAFQLVFYRDGAGATVTVEASQTTNRTDLFLKVNGKTDAGTARDMITQLLMGHLPMLLHPSAREVLVIGLGSGCTAGAVACHPSLQRLDVVEITPEVVEAAKLFEAHNCRVLQEPRLRLHIEDAKSFLQLSDRRYDAIISAPSNPWMAGVAGVFSLEFYQQCREHLAEGGVMVQWVQTYDFSDQTLDTVLATFGQVFPQLSVWQGYGLDVLLVGTVQPAQVDLAALEARLQEPAVKADLKRVQLDSMPVFLSQELVSPSNGAFLAASDARVHSDFFPLLEYAAQRDFFARPAAQRWRQMDENFSPRATTLLALYLKSHPLQKADFEAFARSFSAEGRQFVNLFYSLLLCWQREAPEAIEPLELTARLDYLTAPAELDALRLGPRRERILERAGQEPQLLRHYGLALMKSYRELRSLFYLPPAAELQAVLRRLIEADPDNQRVYQLCLAELAYDRGDDAGCVELGWQGLAHDLPRGAARFELDIGAPVRVAARMADALWRQGKRQAAADLCEATVRGRHLNQKTRHGALPFEVVRRKALASLNQPVTEPALTP